MSLTAQVPGRGRRVAESFRGVGAALRQNVRAGRGKIGGVRSDPSPIAIARGEIR
jgi:hypothetical protein